MRMGDIGTKIEVTLIDEDGKIVDLTAATSVAIAIYGPKGGSTTKPCVIPSPKTSGVAQYTVELGVITTIGTHTYEIVVEFVGGSKFTSSPNDFEVFPTIGGAL